MDKIDTLILSGGSLKGIAYIGVLKALKEKNMLKNIKIIAGTSVGALFACLYVIGYSSEEMEEFISVLDFSLLKNIKIESILKKFGVDEGQKMEFLLEELLKNKGFNENTTFLELYQKTNIKLIMTSVCINDKNICYLSHETFPDLKIITGIRMSTSIPFFYVPIKYENKLYADGAIMNNYPINIFKKRKKIIGVYLNDKQDPAQINNIEDYFFGVFNCVFKGMAIVTINKYEKETIKLELPSVSIINMSISKDLKHQFYNLGYEETLNYLKKRFP
jgi:predicted acylesterase/phospholipase RssA